METKHTTTLNTHYTKILMLTLKDRHTMQHLCAILRAIVLGRVYTCRNIMYNITCNIDGMVPSYINKEI